MAAVSMAYRPLLLRNCPLLSSPILSASSDSSSATTFFNHFSHAAQQRYGVIGLQLCVVVLPGLPITTPLARFHTDGWLPVRMAAFVSLTIISFSHFKSSRMALKDSLSGPSAFFTDSENRARSTACSVTRLCPLPAGGS